MKTPQEQRRVMLEFGLPPDIECLLSDDQIKSLAQLWCDLLISTSEHETSTKSAKSEAEYYKRAWNDQLKETAALMSFWAAYKAHKHYNDAKSASSLQSSEDKVLALESA